MSIVEGMEVETSQRQIDFEVAKFIADNYTVETQAACHKALTTLLGQGYQGVESAILSVIGQSDADHGAVCSAVLDILCSEIRALVGSLGVYIDLKAYAPRLSELNKLYEGLSLVYEANTNPEYSDQLSLLAALAEDSDEYLRSAVMFFVGNSIYECCQHVYTRTFEVIETSREEPDSVLTSDHAKTLRALKAYYESQGYACPVFAFIKEHRFALPMKHTVYHKFLPREFTTVSPTADPLQVALELLSIAFLSSDGYSNPFKAITELRILKDRDLKIKTALERQIASFNAYRMTYEQA